MPAKGSDSFDPDVAAQIDRLANQFEDAWRAGQSPRIEEFLEYIAEPYRNRLFQELKLVEQEMRVERDAVAFHRPAQRNADRNLLVGILALQMNFITREQLIAAMHHWVLEKSTPLEEILLQQRAMPVDTKILLTALVTKHLEMHGGAAEQSLAALSSIRSLANGLGDLADPDVEASLRHVSVISPQSTTDSTVEWSIGESTSQGQRFRIIRPHAEGGLGKVSIARDQELNREVALKEIKEHFARDDNSQARFLQEAEITGRLEHPGIVPVYGLGQYADGRPFYAMRFIRGESLKDAIHRFHQRQGDSRKIQAAGDSRLELRMLLRRFVDVCHAIAYAHHRGVLHRDLKPGNIMLGKHGETLVVDWGLAKPIERELTESTSDEGTLRPQRCSDATPTILGSAVGTPAFMSPEQAAGRLDELGPASDVYSLGATMYYLLTGKPPVTGTIVEEVLRLVQKGQFPAPRSIQASVPRALEAICLKAMALSPNGRYGSPLQLAEDIERWLADESVRAYSEPYTDRIFRWFRRHHAWLWSAGACGLVSSLAAGFVVGRAPESRFITEGLVAFTAGVVAIVAIIMIGGIALFAIPVGFQAVWRRWTKATPSMPADFHFALGPQSPLVQVISAVTTLVAGLGLVAFSVFLLVSFGDPNPITVGFVISMAFLALGVMTALGVAYWLNRR